MLKAWKSYIPIKCRNRENYHNLHELCMIIYIKNQQFYDDPFDLDTQFILQKKTGWQCEFILIKSEPLWYFTIEMLEHLFFSNVQYSIE